MQPYRQCDWRSTYSRCAHNEDYYACHNYARGAAEVLSTGSSGAWGPAGA